MRDFIFLAPHYLYLLALLPLWLLLGAYHSQQERKQLAYFRQHPLNRRPVWRTNLWVLSSLAALTLALAQPAWNPEPVHETEQGRDVIFLVDVSRSMLAADALPSRLEASRQAIREVITQSQNDRFGLVAFAGSTVIKSPLTHDKRFFLYLLDQLSTESVAYGGTRIEDALFKVFDKMIPKESDSSAIDLVMLTDGEDLGSKPIRAIEKLNQMNIRLLVIGLGDSETGARIPSRDGKGWVFHEGREFWSKMQTKPLRHMTQAADKGIFFPVGTANFNLAESIAQLRQLWPGSGRSESQRLRYTEGYPVCLFIAALCQCLLLLNRKRKLLLASLFLFSFNSQAFWGSPSLEKADELPVDAIEQAGYNLQQIEQIAKKRAAYAQNEAAELYAIIARNSDDLNLVITAHYNEAICYIQHAEEITEAFNEQDLMLISDEEFDIVGPLTFYRFARELLQKILQVDPNHLPAAKSLQYLMSIEAVNNDLMESQEGDQENSDANESDEQEGESDEEQESDTESEDQQQEQENPQEGDDQGKREDSQMEINELRLPPPNATAEEIISAAKQIDTYQRSPAPTKQSQIKQDW